MAGALEIMRDHRRKEAAAQAARETKNAGGPSQNKGAPAAPPRLPGLALPSSRFSSKGARGLAIEHKLTEADFAGVATSGQQDRYTIEDVKAIVARKNGTPATPPATTGSDDE